MLFNNIHVILLKIHHSVPFFYASNMAPAAAAAILPSPIFSPQRAYLLLIQHYPTLNHQATFGSSTSTTQSPSYIYQTTRRHHGNHTHITTTHPLPLPPLPILTTAAMLFNYTHVILLKSIVPSSKSLHSKWPILFNNTTNIFLKSIRHLYTIPL